jgi:predicted small lipoprotein YifL
MMNQSILVFAMLFAATACTTMNPIEMPPEAVQQKIVFEDILQPGKQAKIVTSDGRIQTVRVMRVEAASGVIVTDGEPIQIADIVAVETRDFSIGKTALLAAGSYTALALLALAVAPVFIL